jgi:hypothetical protein
MRALVFKSKIKNNQILIPARIQSELKDIQDKNVKVIMLVEGKDQSEDLGFKETTQRQFLEGYSDSDAIYDNY